MMRFRLVLPIMATGSLLLLGGCVTSTSYDATAEAMGHSPELLADRIADCTKRTAATPGGLNELRQEAKLPVGTSDATVAETVCRRSMTAIAKGRMTYDDLSSAFNGTPKPIVYKVIQGR
ncbi:hypothetical protein NS226_08635 [Aureimonas ureilytica]|uniref:Lipoprotein n=1 Tax=Aureimonas ureilytica TaxID=401562 RepID=A0A175R9V0_9HYPH|nr:hypothetical protein [Aureimonas ureilytica]KTQ96103.1 hypothetical protein NS226_08635 [Aureimonas ureilytica]